MKRELNFRRGKGMRPKAAGILAAFRKYGGMSDEQIREMLLKAKAEAGKDRNRA